MDEEFYSGHKKDNGYQQQVGYLYFILAAEFNRIKIGITIRSLNERMKELQTGSCTPLTLLGYSMFQNPEMIENRLHILFGEKRVQFPNATLTEWFYGDALLYHFIYNFAHRITNDGAFPDGIAKFSHSNPSSNHYAGEIAKLKQYQFHDDINRVLKDSRPIKLTTKQYDNFIKSLDAFRLT